MAQERRVVIYIVVSDNGDPRAGLDELPSLIDDVLRIYKEDGCYVRCEVEEV